MARCSVVRSPDGLSASLLVTPGNDTGYPSVDDLRQALVQHGVVFGINDAKLVQMAAQKLSNVRVEVAKGVLPVPGEDARIETLVDTSQHGKPRVRDDGTVDMRDLQFATNVRKGTPLQRRVPPTPGQDGMDVLGRSIKAPAPKDARFALGPGLAISPANPDLLVAAIDGALMVYPDGRLEVRTDKTIHGDVDYSTGNVVFSGNLTINGTVRAGFEVCTEGRCTVLGSVEDSVVSAKSVLDVHGGAVGSGRGVLKAGVHLKVRHAENVSLESESDIVIAEDAINCRMSAKGMIIARSVVGGVARPGTVLDVGSVGNAAEVRTVVDAGGQDLLTQQKDLCLKKLAHLVTEIGVAKEAMFAMVRDGMNEQGQIDAKTEVRLEALKFKCRDYAVEQEGLQKRIEEINAVLTSYAPPVLKMKRLYPNVVIKFGAVERVMKDLMSDVKITFEGERMVVGKQ